MPIPNGEPPRRMRLEMRVSESTYELLTGLDPSLGKQGQMGRPRNTVDLGPLLDTIAGHLESFIETLPMEARLRFARRRKLTSAQVRVIRASGEPLKCLAAEHRVSMASISMVRKGQAYRWVK